MIFFLKKKGKRVIEYLNEAIYILQSLSAIFHSHFQGTKRSRKLLIFKDLGKKLNDRIKVCILIKTTNSFEFILAVVALCYEIYNLYWANSSCQDSLSEHLAAIFDFVYILVLCNCGQDRGISEEFDAVRLAKN